MYVSKLRGINKKPKTDTGAFWNEVLQKNAYNTKSVTINTKK